MNVNFYSLFRYLHVFLHRIKSIPWFSILFGLLLSYGAYQAFSSPHSEVKNRIKYSMHRVKHQMSNMGDSLGQRALLKPLFVRSSKTDPTPAKFSKTVHLPYEKRLKGMEERNQALQMKVEALQHTIERMQTQWSELHQMVQVQAQTSAHLKQTYTTLSSKVEEVSLLTLEASKDKDYSVYAVLQGRAWLHSKEGKIITVSIGSVVEPFGVVERIDIENRFVYFDKGAIFGPSHHDA